MTRIRGKYGHPTVEPTRYVIRKEGRLKRYLLSYRGNRLIDYPDTGEIFILPPPSERRGRWDVTVQYTAVPEPTRFVSYLGSRGDICFGAQAFLQKKRL